jgi:hypothetical protein
MPVGVPGIGFLDLEPASGTVAARVRQAMHVIKATDYTMP